MSKHLPKILLHLGEFPDWDDLFSGWAMYKGYWGIVSGDTKCPDPAASTAKAKEAGLRNKEIAAWKDIDQRAAGTILLMLSAEEHTALCAHAHPAVRCMLVSTNTMSKRSLLHATVLISSF